MPEQVSEQVNERRTPLSSGFWRPRSPTSLFAISCLLPSHDGVRAHPVRVRRAIVGEPRPHGRPASRHPVWRRCPMTWVQFLEPADPRPTRIFSDAFNVVQAKPSASAQGRCAPTSSSSWPGLPGGQAMVLEPAFI